MAPPGAGPCGRDGSRDSGVQAELVGAAARRDGQAGAPAPGLCLGIPCTGTGSGCRTGWDVTRQGGMRLGETSGAGRWGRAGAAGPVPRGLHHRFLLYGDCTCGKSGTALGWRGGGGAVAQASRPGSGAGSECSHACPPCWLAPGHRGARQSHPCPCPPVGDAVARTDFAPSRGLDLGACSPVRCVAH